MWLNLCDIKTFVKLHIHPLSQHSPYQMYCQLLKLRIFLFAGIAEKKKLTMQCTTSTNDSSATPQKSLSNVFVYDF